MKHDNNRDTLFKNSEKEVATHPDYKGTANIDGEEFWLNAWLNESKAGLKYLSLRFKPKQPANADPPEKPPFNDDLPW
jgi:hypothetical protein